MHGTMVEIPSLFMDIYADLAHLNITDTAGLGH